MDINAKLASEVAISILAEVIEYFRNKKVGSGSCCGGLTATEAGSTTAEDIFAEDYYINPVCNVPVSKKNPKHIVEYKGQKVYFCCDGCKVSFENNPGQYSTGDN